MPYLPGKSGSCKPRKLPESQVRFILTIPMSCEKFTLVLQSLWIRGLVGTGEVILFAICPKLPKRANLSWPVLTQECVFPEFANSIV
jgi:hypothetical protein